MTIYGKDFWEIVKPLETTNLVQNPSMETGTTGWAGASGAAVARTTASQFFGIYGLQVTPTSASSDGAYYGADSLGVALTGSLTYYYSLYFKGQAGIGYNMFITNATGGNQQSSCTQWTATGNWERQGLLFEPVGSGSRRLYVTKDGSADTGVFILDGVQMEEQGEASTYCDGDQLGCIWLADPHGSKSWRDGESKAGGQIVNLNSEYDIIVRQMPGAGMPPVDNISTNLGIQDGGLFQRTKTNVRSLTLEGVVTGSDTNDFHYQRQRLIDLFKPDQGAPQGPFLLRYTTASAVTKQIKAHYDSGLEMTQIDANKEFFSARVISYDPYWEEIKDNAQELDVNSTLSSGDLFARVTGNSSSNEGSWIRLGSSFVSGISVLGPDNKIYFTVQSGTQTVKRYNPQSQAVETFLPTTAGCGFFLSTPDAGVVYAIDFDTAGDLYIGGDFTAAGSTSACKIVKWNGTDFESLAGNDGFDSTVLDIKVDERNNTIYVAGLFDNSGSNAINRIAKLSPGDTEFSQLGDGVTIDPATSDIPLVYSIAIEQGGSNLYIGGCFTDSGSISVCGVAYFNGNEFEGLGAACLNGGVYSIATKPDDTLFIGGGFTGVFPDSSGSPSYFTHWNGNDYIIDGTVSPCGEVQSIAYNPANGKIGVVSSSNGTKTLPNAGGYYIWDGSIWTFSTLNISDFSGRSLLYQNGVEVVSLGSNNTPSQGTRALVNNPGTATVYPDLVFNLPSGTASNLLYFVDNISASKSLQLQYTILGGETVTLSLENGTAFSDIRGNIVGSIIPGSNFSSWRLLPGNNIIVPFASSDNTNLFIKWKNKHWSIDGGFS